MSRHPKIVTLHDKSSGATAKIAVGLGFNCFSFQVRSGSQEIETLWAAPDFESGAARPSGSGIPILFPFPGRIAEGTFTWNGASYVLEPNDGRSNAIHGFVYTRPWRVLFHDHHKVVAEFHAAEDDARLLAFWPSDFRIRGEYELQGQTLHGLFTFDNPGRVPLPCGFGTHPYFRLPLGGEDAGDCVVTLPVSEEWELSDLIPTGMRHPLRDAAMFQQGLRYSDMQFDNVFGGLVFDEDGRCRSTIRDPSTPCRVTMSFDKSFTACVVYTPGHREAVCVEPLTCVPNAVRLHAAGIPSGLTILEPGHAHSVAVDLSVS